MYISGENLLITSLLINGLLGGISGLWLRVPVLVPLVAFAILEVGIPDDDVAVGARVGCCSNLFARNRLFGWLCL